MLADNEKIPEDEYFVFYNNLKSPDGSVKHWGDNRTGEGEGDDGKDSGISNPVIEWILKTTDSAI